MDAKATKLTGLWLKTSKAGKRYLKGSFSIEALHGLLADVEGDRVDLLLFINTKRPGKEETDPDYTAHIVKQTPKPKPNPARGYTPDPDEPF